MAIRQILKRELEVACDTHSQPVGFKIAKFIVLGLTIYFLWGTAWLWITLLVLFIAAMALHFWYRYKTKGWTRSYGMWKHESMRRVI